MAETVQYMLEAMIPELEDLEEKQLFTKIEITSIVKQRRKHEYALRRPAPRKSDFLKYIEYELNLEALRRKRKTRIIGNGGKKTISDYTGIRRVNFLFERLVRRYHGDVALWIQYAEFARSQDSPRLLSRVLVRALQYHPGNASLWIMAAKWEFEGNSNTVAARSLLQRGLRLIPSSADMWHAYHGLELAYITKLIQRRSVLGIDAAIKEELAAAKAGEERRDAVDVLPEGDEEIAVEFDTEGDGHIALPTISSEEFAEVVLSPEEQAEEDRQRDALRTNSDAFLAGMLPRIVFRHALIAIPNDLDFVLAFAQRYEEAGVSTLEDAKADVWAAIAASFARDSAARARLASRHTAGIPPLSPEYVDALRIAVAAFAQAILDIPTVEMHERRATYLQEALAATDNEDLSLFLAQSILSAYQEASAAHLMSPAMYAAYINFLVDVAGEKEKATDIAKEATTAFPSDKALWILRIHLADSKEDKMAVLSLASRHCLGDADVWALALDHLELDWSNGEISHQNFQDVLWNAVAQTATLNLTSEEYAPTRTAVQIRYIDWIRAQISAGTLKDDDSAYSLSAEYNRVIKDAFATIPFLLHCITIEEALAPSVSDAFARVSNLYEQATRLAPRDEALWLSYLRHIIAAGKFKMAVDIYARASRALPDPDTFSTAYQALLEGGN